MSRRLWLGSVLAVLAVLSGIAVWWLRPAPPPPVVVERADYVLEQFEMLALQKDGAEGFSVRGPLLTRDARGEDITLQTPEFGLPDAQGQRWVARSGVAVVNGDQTEVRLRDGVTIDSAPGATPTRFSTDHLTILPEQDRADTPATVTLQQGDSILRGRGLTVDLANKTYVLHNDVQARLAVRRARPAGD